MILDNEVEVKIINHNIKHYINLGYDVKYGDMIKIKPEELSKGSNVIVNCKCDNCYTEKKLKYQDYNIVFTKNNKYICNKCRIEILNNYNNTKKDLMKNNRLISTNKKYGVDNVFQLNVVKNKIKNTNIEKYGVDSYTKTEEYLKKSEKTSIEKYGVKNPMKNNDIKTISINNSKIKRTETTLSLYKNIGIINVLSNGYYEFKCDNNCEHNFLINRQLLYNRKHLNTILCTICNPIGLKNSGLELELFNFIKDNYNNEILTNNRNIIHPLELDIYLPDLKIAFEFNGLFWHSEINKENNYHLNKTEKCEKKGIQLIQIYEDDWLYKQDIIKSMILNKLNRIKNKIYARKCNIKEIDNNKLIREFLEKNHIQGFVGSKIKLGLFYNNELVSLMTFGDRRVAMGKKSTKEKEHELLRFCNKLNINVVGGASKLFKYFINKYNPSEITTYSDRSYSKGNLYNQLGFNYIGKTGSNYYYIIDNIRCNRFNFRKDLLVKKGYDKSKSEHQIMIERKIYRIYDSGNLNFIYK